LLGQKLSRQNHTKEESIVRAKTLSLIVLCVSVMTMPTLGFAGSKGAKKAAGKSLGNYAHVDLRARLLPAPGISEEMAGVAKYENKANSKGSEEKLLSRIKIPIPSSLLEISTADLPLLFHTTFLLKISQVSTTGSPPVTTSLEKGSCTMLLKRVVFDYEQGNVLESLDAEYDVALREKAKGTGMPELKKRIGNCSVVAANPTSGGAVTLLEGIPDIAEGDVAEVYVLEQTAPGGAPLLGTLLLTGTFTSQQHDDHDDDDEDDDD
jgi:hypothetical protein